MELPPLEHPAPLPVTLPPSTAASDDGMESADDDREYVVAQADQKEDDDQQDMDVDDALQDGSLPSRSLKRRRIEATDITSIDADSVAEAKFPVIQFCNAPSDWMNIHFACIHAAWTIPHSPLIVCVCL